MKFINRNSELNRLDTLLSKKQGGLAVIWGRRRVGKTRLLLEWSKKNNGLYTVADQSASTIQRSYFATSLARPLSHLIDLGILEREISFGELEKSTKRSLYKINDPFFRFWFKVVAPYKSLLAEAPFSSRLSVFSKYKQTLFSEAWEELCRKCIPHLQKVDSPLSQLGPWGIARRYWKGNNPEWDVVAESIDGKRLLLGEVKWYSGITTDRKINKDYMALVRKGIPAIINQDKYEIVYALFIPETAGVKTEINNIYIVDAATVVTCLK